MVGNRFVVWLSCREWCHRHLSSFADAFFQTNQGGTMDSDNGDEEGGGKSRTMRMRRQWRDHHEGQHQHRRGKERQGEARHKGREGEERQDARGVRHEGDTV